MCSCINCLCLSLEKKNQNICGNCTYTTDVVDKYWTISLINLYCQGHVRLIFKLVKPDLCFHPNKFPVLPESWKCNSVGADSIQESLWNEKSKFPVEMWEWMGGASSNCVWHNLLLRRVYYSAVLGHCEPVSLHTSSSKEEVLFHF